MLYEMEKELTPIPKATDAADLIMGAEGFVRIISCDTEFYLRYFDKQTANAGID